MEGDIIIIIINILTAKNVMEIFDEIHTSSIEMVAFEACLFFMRNTSKRGM
jgi:hypothetical protein